MLLWLLLAALAWHAGHPILAAFLVGAALL